MSIAGHPVVVRRAEPSDAEAIHTTFLGARAIAGTLQLPYPSVEMWRRRLAEGVSTDYLLVATIAGEVVGNLGLRAASKSPRRRHVGDVGMAVRDDRQRRGVGTALMHAAIELADGWLNYQRLELTVLPTTSRRWRCIASSDSPSKALAAPMRIATAAMSMHT